ncbi:hypothetical protein M0R01_01780 [bacterium]|nr:hypothetical protein [bacterium]
MSKYERIVKRLIENVSSVSPTSNVENVIIDLLEVNDICGAVDIAKKINPGPQFASAFANELLTVDAEFIKDDSFIAMKKIAGEDIIEEEADIVLGKYTGPGGKNHLCFRSVPEVILQTSSKEAMIRFFEFILEDKTVGNMDCVRTFWPYLKEKI